MSAVFHLDIINILVLLVAIISAVLGVIVYTEKKDGTSNIFFFWLVFAVSMWCASMFAYRSSSSVDDAILFSRMLYVSAAAMPFAFIFFVFSFCGHLRDIPVWVQRTLFVPFIYILLVAVVPNGLIQAIRFIPGHESIIVFHPLQHMLYAVYIISYFGLGYILLFRKLRAASGVFRAQLIYILAGTLISTSIGVMTNLILLLFGNFSLNWLGQVGVIFMMIFIAYAILEHHLFDIKIILTEGLSLMLVFILIIQLSLSTQLFDLIANTIMLVSVGILLSWLTKSVRNEVEQRQRTEELAKQLSDMNEHLRLLDQQKSEFVSIASHQLRSPLTAIKGYSSMLLEGDYGKLSQKTRGAVDRIYQSSIHLVGVVEDFLNISRIEQGRMQYQFATVDLKEMVVNVVEEVMPRAVDKKQKLELIIEKHESYNVTADAGKIRQVISNLIDNAIKYTPDGGEITVHLMKDIARRKVIFSVKDNGIGMTPQTISLLFQKFSRADGVRKVYTEGIGLGLYVASEMMKSHHGRIWAESEGEHKGSTFSIELLAEEEH